MDLELAVAVPVAVPPVAVPVAVLLLLPEHS